MVERKKTGRKAEKNGDEVSQPSRFGRVCLNQRKSCRHFVAAARQVGHQKNRENLEGDRVVSV